MIHSKSILFAVVLLMTGCSSDVVYFQPKVPYSGRATAITAQITLEKNMVVASETGGLFYSFNKGVKWWHRRTGTYFFTDVDFLSSANVVIATAKIDSRVNNGGGIWRSSNKGETWKRIPISIACLDSVSAYCVTPESGSKVWVGTSCGAYYSTDAGLTWQKQITTYPNSEVRSIQVIGNRMYFLINDIGIIKSTDGGLTWTNITPTGFASLSKSGVHNCLEVTYQDVDHLYFATYNNNVPALFFTRNGGATWEILKNDVGSLARPVFVRRSRISQVSSDHYIYFGDGVRLYRKHVNVGQGGTVSFNKSWEQLQLGHADPSDICFETLDPKALVVASDGGLQKTANSGSTWQMVGENNNGYSALQITEVTGINYGENDYDLIFATQDNSLWGSRDKGATWPETKCCEGFWLTGYGTNRQEAVTIGVGCSANCNWQAGSAMENDHEFANAPNQNGSPALLKRNYYVQSTDIEGDGGHQFKITKNNGSTWNDLFYIADDVGGAPVTVLNRPDNPVLYIPVRNGSLANGDKRFTLKRVSNLMGDPEDVVIEDIENFGGLGIFRTAFSFYRVFGANPQDPNHIIIGDIEEEVMKVSHDGGQTWTVDNELTNLVTDNGKLKFRNYKSSIQCQVIAFNPTKPWHILVGTAQGGVISSKDGGNSWKRIEDSKNIYNISSFFFHPRGVVFSTYGRGLYRLKDTAPDSPPGVVRPPVVRPPVLAVWDINKKVNTPASNYFDKYYCKECELHLVKNGSLKGINTGTNGELELSIDGEYLFLVAQDGRTTKSELKVMKIGAEYAMMNLYDLKLEKLKSLKGVIVVGNKLMSLVFYDGLVDEAVASGLKPVVKNKVSITVAAAKSKGYVNGLTAGEPFEISGRYFMDESNSVFKVYLNETLEEDLGKELSINDDGSFKLVVNKMLMPGSYAATVVQAVGGKEIKASCDFAIRNNDTE